MMSWSGSSSSVDGWRKGPWTSEEDKVLMEHVRLHGEGRWSSVSRYSPGLKRNGKSCRLRWVNYLRPGLKRGHITPQEETIIIQLHALWGNKWSTIARYLPGRTDNEIKNYWRTHFKKETEPSKQKLENRKAQFLNQKTYFQQQQQQQPPTQVIRRTSDDEFEDAVMPRVEEEDHDHYFFPEDLMMSSAWSPEFPNDLQDDDVFLGGGGGLWNNMEADTTTSTHYYVNGNSTIPKNGDIYNHLEPSPMEIHCDVNYKYNLSSI